MFTLSSITRQFVTAGPFSEQDPGLRGGAGTTMIDSYDDSSDVFTSNHRQQFLTTDPFNLDHSSSDSIYFRYPNVTQIIPAAASGDFEPFRLRYNPWVTVAIVLIASLLSVATSGGNLLVIAAFRVDSQLQRVNNYFLLSLAFADFAIGAVSMPLFTVYLLLGRWPLGK